MRKMAQTVLPFKLAATDEPMTAQSGLVLHGEFIRGLGLHRWLEQEMPKPGSKRGYGAVPHVLPFVLMLTAGGRSLEDLRMIHMDKALRGLLHLGHLPGTDAAGDWLRRTGEGEGLAGLDRVNRRIVAQRLRKLGRTAHTLDIDATQIVAEKRDAAMMLSKQPLISPSSTQSALRLPDNTVRHCLAASAVDLSGLNP